MSKIVKEITLDREYISQILIALGAARMSFEPPMTDANRLARDTIQELECVIRMVSNNGWANVILCRPAITIVDEKGGGA